MGIFSAPASWVLSIFGVLQLTPKKLRTLRIQSPDKRTIEVYNHLLSKVFRFYYHSQKVIGSIGEVSVKFIQLAFLINRIEGPKNTWHSQIPKGRKFVQGFFLNQYMGPVPCTFTLV